MLESNEESVCILCNEAKIPSGKTISGRFFCNCGMEWILEKRKQQRYPLFVQKAEYSDLLPYFITIFDSNLNLNELLLKTLSIFSTRLNITKSGIALVDYTNNFIKVEMYVNEGKQSHTLKKFRINMDTRDHPFTLCLEESHNISIKLSDYPNKFYKLYSKITGAKFQVLIPILYNRIPIGILILDFDKEEQQETAMHSISIIELFVQQLGIALQHSTMHVRTSKLQLNYKNLHTSSLILNQLYMNNTIEVIKMTLFTISGFIDTNLNLLLIKDNTDKSTTIFKLTKSIDSIDFSQESISEEDIIKYEESWFSTQEPLLEFISEEPLAQKIGLKGEQVLILPSFMVENTEYLYLMSRNTRLFGSDEIEVLSAYVKQVKITIENAFLTHRMADKERLKTEVEIARDIQDNLLPKKMPEHPRYQFAGFMVPAREIGGDYYDFVTSPDHSDLLLAIGDVSGKGIPAGMVMATARTIIHSIARKESTPWEIIQGLNAFIYYNYNNSHVMRFMSLIAMRWKADSDTFTFSGAGHGNFLVYRKNLDKIQIIQSGGVVLGIQKNIDEFFNEDSIDIDAGDILLMYTDGVTEAVNSKLEFFEEERLIQSFYKNKDLVPSVMLTKINEDVRKFRGPVYQHDDITLLAFKRTS